MTNTDQTSTEIAATGPDREASADVLADNLAEQVHPATADGETDGNAAGEAVEDGSATTGDSDRPDTDGAVENAGDRDEDDDDEDGEEDNPLEVEAEVAADYLEELLDIADLDGDIDTYVDGDRAHVSIVSESDTLVGKDGQVLDALQELTRLAVLAETGQRSRLMLDVAGYRARRRTELIALVADAVEEVKESAEPVHLKAMNPFERKIVHDAVAAAGLTSESEGEEPRRHVVVLPTRD
jgi:spoIIIJ-associated protein